MMKKHLRIDAFSAMPDVRLLYQVLAIIIGSVPYDLFHAPKYVPEWEQPQMTQRLKLQVG